MTRSRALFAIAACALVLGTGAWRLRSEPRPSGTETASGASPDAAATVEDATNPVPREVRVPILAYHNVRPTPDRPLSAADKQYEVTPEQFDAQMAHLAAEGYSSIGFGDLAAAVRGERDLPEKPVIITLDDGRAAQYDNALPILERHGLIATFFVFTNAIDRPGYLSTEQILALRGKGMAVESHTRYHQYLTRMETDEEIRAELRTSKARLEGILGTSVTVVAYPFGLVDERVAAIAKEEGYAMGRGLAHTAKHGPDDLMTLGSYITTGDMRAFKAILSAAQPRPQSDETER